MDSSFLTGLHIGLGLFACLLFLKLIIQFGLPNHPLRFISYLVALSVSTYFVGLAATDLNLISPFAWIRWRSLPLIVGSLCLLFQTLMMVGNFGRLQEQVFSRLPLMAALLAFAFFSDLADALVCWFLIIGGLFLSISVKKARYESRLYQKMLLMFLIHLGLTYINSYPVYVMGQVFLVFTVFYLFLFEHSSCLKAMMSDFKEPLKES